MDASPRKDGAHIKGLLKQILTEKWTHLQCVRNTVLMSWTGVMASISFQTIAREIQTAFQDKEQN